MTEVKESKPDTVVFENFIIREYERMDVEFEYEKTGDLNLLFKLINEKSIFFRTIKFSFYVFQKIDIFIIK